MNPGKFTIQAELGSTEELALVLMVASWFLLVLILSRGFAVGSRFFWVRFLAYFRPNKPLVKMRITRSPGSFGLTRTVPNDTNPFLVP